MADPSRATLYNPHQPFRRVRISPDGDQTDWIAFDSRLARDAVAHFSPQDADAERPFRFRAAAICHSIYLEQRALFTEIERGLDDRFEIEERAIRVLSRVLGGAYASSYAASPTARTRQLVEGAREAIHETLFDNAGIADIARRLNVSVFHLCRVFRASTGMTLHCYRRDLRLRVALGFISAHRGQLSSLALQVGFDSHSHFTAAFRRAFGVAPAAII